jgi:hypothetical protein
MILILNHNCPVKIKAYLDIATTLLKKYCNMLIYKDITTTLYKTMLRSSYIFLELFTREN